MAAENLSMGEDCSPVVVVVCSELRRKGDDEVICAWSVYVAGTTPVAEAFERAWSRRGFTMVCTTMGAFFFFFVVVLFVEGACAASASGSGPFRRPLGDSIRRFVTGQVKFDTAPAYLPFATSQRATVPFLWPDNSVIPSYDKVRHCAAPSSDDGGGHHRSFGESWDGVFCCEVSWRTFWIEEEEDHGGDCLKKSICWMLPSS